MPAPPPESEPATIRTRPFMVPLAWSLWLLRRLAARTGVLGAVRGREDSVTNIADNGGEEVFVLALGHHPDHPLGAPSTDDETPRSAETRLRGGNGAAVPHTLPRPGLRPTGHTH